MEMALRMCTVSLFLFIAVTLVNGHFSPLSILERSRAELGGIFKAWSGFRLDPEANMNFTQICDYHGYHCEEYLHEVNTSDGFLLTLHRINGRKGEDVTNQMRRPVFVQHGLLGDSSMWILNPPSETLPFLLSDAGYDVWLGNSRGNTYSKKHKTLSPHQQEFWAWSWDEMAQFDLPASIDFVLAKTGYKQLHYVGHSQGTLIGFVHLSTVPNTKISHMIALGPVFKLAHMSSPIKYLSPFAKDFALVLKILGLKDFLPSDWIMRLLGDYVCNKEDPLSPLCGDILFLICGFDRKQLNDTRIPVYLNHSPAGTSVQDIIHFAQMYETKNCSRYDYGSAAENMKHYGQKTPPYYDISSITTPVSLFWAQNDLLADPEDVKYIIKNVKTIKNNVYLREWNHLDFLWAVDSKPAMIDRVIDILNKDLNH